MGCTSALLLVNVCIYHTKLDILVSTESGGMQWTIVLGCWGGRDSVGVHPVRCRACNVLGQSRGTFGSS